MINLTRIFLIIVSIAFLFSCAKKESEKKGLAEVADSTKFSMSDLITYDDSVSYVYKNEFNPSYKSYNYLLKKGHSVRFCTKNTRKVPFLFLVLTTDTLVRHDRIPANGGCKCYTQPVDPDRDQMLRIVYHFKKKVGRLFWDDVKGIKDSTKIVCYCNKGPFSDPKGPGLKPSIVADSGVAGTVTTSVEEK
jgi:hypothetical protein